MSSDEGSDLAEFHLRVASARAEAVRDIISLFEFEQSLNFDRDDAVDREDDFRDCATSRSLRRGCVWR